MDHRDDRRSAGPTEPARSAAGSEPSADIDEHPAPANGAAATPADDIVERAIHLWSRPLPEGKAALERFRKVYIDPISVNGEVIELQVLAERARMLQHAIDGIRHDLHDVISTPGRRTFAFTIAGRHTGTLTSALGDTAATGRNVSVTGIDIFTVDETTGQVTDIWAVADWLGLLLQVGAVSNDRTQP